MADGLPETPSPEEIVQYVEQQGWELDRNRSGQPRLERHNLLIKTCPFCGNAKSNFEISIGKDGAPYSCHACGEAGNIFTLRKQFPSAAPAFESRPVAGIKTLQKLIRRPEEPKTRLPIAWMEPYQKALWDGRCGALTYLMEERGFTEETIRHFGLGLDEERRWRVQDEEGEQEERSDEGDVKYHPYPAIVIPSIVRRIDQRGHTETWIALVQYRTVPPARKMMSRRSGMETVFFHEEGLEVEGETIYVTEGWGDCMAAWQAGIRNVVGTTAGANSWPPTWIEQLERYQQVVLPYDEDAAGRSGREKLCQRLGEERVRWVRGIPEHSDCNDVLHTEGAPALFDILTHHRAMPMDGVSGVDAVIDALRDKIIMGESLNKWLPWKVGALGKMTRDIMPGDLIIIAGASASGKTTLSIDQIVYACVERGIPTLINCPEMTPEELVIMVLQNVLRVRKEDLQDLDVLAQGYERLKDAPLYFESHNSGVTDLQRSIDTMDKCFKRYGIELVLVDNLNYLARFEKGEHLESQARITVHLKNWAVRHHAAVILIHHSRKDHQGKIGGMNNWYGSSMVPADVNIGIQLAPIDLAPQDMRDLMEEAVERPKYLPMIPVLQDKLRGAKGSAFGWVYFEGDYATFRDCTRDDFANMGPDERKAMDAAFNHDEKKKEKKGW